MCSFGIVYLHMGVVLKAPSRIVVFLCLSCAFEPRPQNCLESSEEEGSEALPPSWRGGARYREPLSLCGSQGTSPLLVPAGGAEEREVFHC